jgi:hypothetical protein
MTKQQTPSTDTLTQAPQEHDAKGDDRPDVAFVIEDDLWRAMALNDLAHWIVKAQRFIESVRLAVGHNHALQEILSQRGVALHSPEWQAHHAEGMEVLHMTMDDHLVAVRRGAGLEHQGAPAQETATETSKGSRNDH